MKTIATTLILMCIGFALHAQKIRKVYGDHIRLKTGVDAEHVIAEVETYFRTNLGHGILAIHDPVSTDSLHIKVIKDTIKHFFFWPEIIEYDLVMTHQITVDTSRRNKQVIHIESFVCWKDTQDHTYKRLTKKHGSIYAKEDVIAAIRRDLFEPKDWI